MYAFKDELFMLMKGVNGVLSAMCKCISRYKIDSRELEYQLKHTIKIHKTGICTKAS